jgi:hypothetical protein
MRAATRERMISITATKFPADWLFVANPALKNFLGMLPLGCCLILQRNLLGGY